MDMHNIDDYLDLQDQTETNLLVAEPLTSQSVPHEQELDAEGHEKEHGQEKEEEWHAVAGPLNDILTTNNYFHPTENWGVLDNDNRNMLTSTPENFITPEALIKTPTPPMPSLAPLELPEMGADKKEETRVTRSSKGKPTVAAKKRKTTTRAKKLYCICQQPYNGKPMVQCDKCGEWFHCMCVDFDPDEQNEEDIDWVCKNCLEAPSTTAAIEKEVPSTETEEAESKATSISPTISPRQTRAARAQSKCLYTGCSNRTRADSFCSDVCAQKQNEGKPDVANAARPSRRASMRPRSNMAITEAAPNSPVKKSSPKQKSKKKHQDNTDNIDELEYKEEENTNDDDDDDGDGGGGGGGGGEKEDEEDMTSTTHGSNTPDTPMSPGQMTELENPVRRNVIKSLTTLFRTILNSINDSPESTNIDATAEELAKSIENSMLQHLGTLGPHGRRTCGEPYKLKFRSLLYNLKDKANTDFQHRVVNGQLTPLALVSMSSEEMANPKLRSMSEVLRERGLKNSVMKLPDPSTIVKKTHKGEVVVSNHGSNEKDDMYSAQVQQELDKAYQAHQQQHHVMEEEKRPSVSSFAPASSSSADPLDDILARIGIPTTAAAPTDDRTSSKRQDGLEAVEDPAVKKRKVTLDVEALLGEEEDTPYQVEEVDTTELMQDGEEAEDQKDEQEQNETKEESTLPTIWHGRVNMPQVAEFEASARQIGGRPLTESEWQDVLSPTMWIEGRIPADRVTNYVTQTQYSTSREIVLLEVEADAQGQAQSQTLLQYLDSRSRYAVVGHNKTKIKDFYLIPLFLVQQVPDFLYVVRVEETKRKSDLFLGVLVLTKQHHTSVSSPVTHKKQQQPTHQAQLPTQPAAYSKHNYDYQSSYDYPYKSSY